MVIHTLRSPIHADEAAVFLDRDGVLIEDSHLLTRPDQMVVFAGVPQALRSLAKAGFKLIVVSNQTVISRGLASEQEVQAVNDHMESLLQSGGAKPLDGIYICPHHPKATLPRYRIACDCRKPRPGLFLQAARDHGIDLPRSFAIGDRITDIIAGAKAGCRTILVQSGKHADAPIESPDAVDVDIEPDYTCADLPAAAAWILKHK
jgi:D-glycero-D-manno-heptose 1,7-bisphosphate phosphatase